MGREFFTRENAMATQVGYNLPPAFLSLHDQAYDHAETTIHKLIDEMQVIKSDCDYVAKLSNRLSHCKAAGTVDFSDDPEMRQNIDHVHSLDPSIFGGQLRYDWQSSTDMDITLQALDGLTKAKFSEVNEKMMFVGKGYDDRLLITEGMQKILDMAIRHLESLVSKQRKT